jgi:hypothetical protein
MKRFLYVVVLLLVTASFVSAQKMSKVETDLIQMDKDWTAAELKGDAAAVGKFIADDFWATTPEGTMQSRAQYMADVKASKDVDVADEYVVRMFGKDVAVMTHRGTVTGEVPVTYRSTHVWVNRGGKWQIVAHHSSEVPSAARSASSAAPAASSERAKPAKAAKPAAAAAADMKPE